jgi:nitrite reductase/ring-hydroxylating ferredoxin subunit
MWEFDARCGKGINPTGERLTPFPVEIADDGTIMVDVGP